MSTIIGMISDECIVQMSASKGSLYIMTNYGNIYILRHTLGGDIWEKIESPNFKELNDE